MIWIIVGFVVLVVVVIGWVKILTNPDIKDDSDYCYNCRTGWCDLTPKSKECDAERSDE